jgi:hypothetical protein
VRGDLTAWGPRDRLGEPLLDSRWRRTPWPRPVKVCTSPLHHLNYQAALRVGTSFAVSAIGVVNRTGLRVRAIGDDLVAAG